MQARDTGPTSESALSYLPCSAIQAFDKGEEIYGSGAAQGHLYLVIEGRVKLSRVSESGLAVVVDVYQVDDFFGESALLNVPRESEHALALEPVQAMAWAAAEITRLVENDPRLAIGLVQLVARRCSHLKSRMESLSGESTSRRLGRALVEFADRTGSDPLNGEITIAPLTHEVLAQYVGTSREIVSHQMSEFRGLGLVRYSRKGISIHRDNLGSWLRMKTKHAS
jgi:CRP-like cAMP-binding protein